MGFSFVLRSIPEGLSCDGFSECSSGEFMKSAATAVCENVLDSILIVIVFRLA